MSRPTSEPPSRRRVDRIVGSALAVLGVVVGLIAVVALHNPNGRQAEKVTASVPLSPSAVRTSPRASRAPTAPARASARSSSAAPTKSVALLVLDSTGNPSLASTAASRFSAAGWRITSTGELTNDILSTAAYYDPAAPGAEQAARALQQQFPAIKRVVPRFAELPAGPVVVVLTSDYS